MSGEEEQANGKVRQEGAIESQACYARNEERHAQERPQREKSDQPQAGNRDRALGSARERREGPAREIFREEEIAGSAGDSGSSGELDAGLGALKLDQRLGRMLWLHGFHQRAQATQPCSTEEGGERHFRRIA